ncbi:MAG TPA: biotin carboxylase N-terminal domain-containing protein [Oligoflexia bacterium]|nr:biotin carboxylase N-terminal domain-containing protein [Oligoflexia bacterium]HMP48095.1 biotin carboxylase N-terminal domain-containing protein [Oligoflexia bacterium]
MKKLLIANRGEIAIRIARSAKSSGYFTVGVGRKVDIDENYLSCVDEVYIFESGNVKETFLSVDSLVKAAKDSGSGFLHPGYGFLSESFELSRMLKKNGIIFIGPESGTLQKLGNKIEARILAKNLNIPLVPGLTIDTASSHKSYENKIFEIGFPVLVKAGAGGGGRGMRIVNNKEDLYSSINSASEEAKRAFGDGSVFLEKYIDKAKHLEVQILRDKNGNCIHLYERDCSYQRRFQKVVEFAPAIGIPDTIKTQLRDSAIMLAHEGNLHGAATFEFLFSPETNKFYFLECNPRLQVEHTVTEQVTGIDIISLQLAIAEGENLPHQSEIKCKGVSIQARVCAEVPEKNFISQSGTISKFSPPENAVPFGIGSNLRYDFGIRSGSRIGTDFDSLLGKLIVHDFTELSARSSLISALTQTRIEGIETNIPYLISILKSSKSLDGVYTRTLQDLNHELAPSYPSENMLKSAEALYPWIINNFLPGTNPFNARFRPLELKSYPPMVLHASHFDIQNEFFPKDQSIQGNFNSLVLFAKYSNSEIIARIHDEKFHIRIINYDPESAELMFNLNGYNFMIKPAQVSDSKAGSGIMSDGILSAPLPGVVLSISALPGTPKESGDILLSFDSMKTEHQVVAPFKGVVDQVFVKEGDKIERGTTLMIFKSALDN